MSINLKHQIIAEINRVREEIQFQKELIKDSIDKPLALETATLEMKALHTRLAVLEATLANEIGSERK